MKPDRAPVLVANGLVVRRGRRDVLHDVDLSVGPGEVIAVLGPNGAGKSTLLGALGGRLKPRAGRTEHRGQLATVMQAPGLASRSAQANVELALAWSGVPRPQRRQRALDALERMQASHLAARPAHSLSGGEQRRIHLARAVAVAPDIMLLDEPFDGLDPSTHTALRDDAATALRSANSAVVVVLHDRIDAWAMADRIVILIDGRVQADGPPHDVLDRPPTPDVARFLGYDGELVTGTGRVLTRAPHVRIDEHGDLEGTVTKVVGIEDGQRVQLTTDRGDVWSYDWSRRLRPGDSAHFTVDGGAHFP